jgi:glucose/arabinose dehydrogenase
MAGRDDCPDDYCGYMPNQMEGMDPKERSKFTPMTDTKTYPDAMTPAWNNNQKSQGTSSAAFLDGEQWGPWDGRLVVGVMGIGFGGTPVGQRIDVIELSEDGKTAEEVVTMSLPMAAGRFRSVVQGPDGSLYAAVDEGDIHKLTPKM